MRSSKTYWLHYKPMTGLMDRHSPPDTLPVGAVRNRLNWNVPEEAHLNRAPGWKKLFYNDSFDAVSTTNVSITSAPSVIGGVTMQQGNRVLLTGQTTTTENGDYIFQAVGSALVPGYNNSDLHDQLLSILNYFDSQDPVADNDDGVYEADDFSTACSGTIKNKASSREPITFQKEFVSSSGVRKLVVGTHSRLYNYNSSTENWQVIADGWGGTFSLDCKMRRWRAAQVGDTVIFTNDYDPPQYWILDSGPMGCVMQAIRPVPDLVDLRITQAKAIVAWRGLVFLGDITMDGRRYPNRIIWSDKDDAIGFDPGKSGTIAGDQVLDQGETVLGFKEIGDYLLIYTSRAIWQVTAVGGDEILNFRKAYAEPLTGDACLCYPNTLVSLGDSHVFAGRNGIYLFNLAMPRPERIKWLHEAAIIAFEDINEQCCDAHVAEYNPSSREIYFSWAKSGEYLPSYSLVVNVQQSAANFLDYGFSSFCNHTRDVRMTWRDFLLEYCICDSSGVADTPYIKEGLPRIAVSPGTCAIIPDSLYTKTALTLTINGIEITTEDWTAEPTANSLCSVLSGLSIDDICRECNADQVFIGASSSDYSLKEIGGVYYRHRCLNPTEVGSFSTIGSWACYSASVGRYAADGYQSQVVSGPIDLGDPDAVKLATELEVEFLAEYDADPPELVCEIGNSAQAIDPMSAEGSCAIVWQKQTVNRFFLECQSLTNEAGHKSSGTRPNRKIKWPLWVRGKYIYWRLTVDKPASAAEGSLPINGSSTFSRVSLKLKM